MPSMFRKMRLAFSKPLRWLRGKSTWVKSILKAYTAEGLKEMEQDEAQRAERKQRGYYDRERYRD